MYRRITAIAARQVGLITRTQLLGVGLHPEAIRRLVQSGRFESVQDGLYRIAGYPPSWDQRLMAALLLGGRGAMISFEAAGMHWKLESVHTTTPHVTVVHAQKTRILDATVHRTRLVAPGDVVRRGPLRVTSPWRTVIDLAGVMPPDGLEDLLDDALRRRLVTVNGLVHRLDVRGRRGVRGVRRLAQLLAERTLQRKKASTLQNRVRRGIERAGLPTPDEEVDVYDRSGRFIGRVDFCYPAKRVFIEVDGSHHETKKQHEDDLVRQNALVRAGWRPLRFSKKTVDAKAYLAEIADLFSGESPTTPT
jgi:hypothetical protein